MAGPAGAEGIAAGGQLADEVGEHLVVRGSAGLGAQQRDDVVDGPVVVGVELRAARVEQQEPGGIGAGRGVEQRRVQRPAGTVGGQVVHPGVADQRRGGHRVEDALHAGADLLRHRGPPATRAGVGRAGQVVEVRALGFRQPQRPGK